MKTQKVYLEHANITVHHISDAVDFFQTAFPHFIIRGGGTNMTGREWIHLGDDITYIALNQLVTDTIFEKNDYDKLGINHMGFVVDNVEHIADRLIAKGYKRNYPKQKEEFRIRDYFLDADGNEFEFVEYLSDNTEERNYYDQ